MKYFKPLLFALMSALAFSSCSDDDPNAKKKNSSMKLTIGTEADVNIPIENNTLTYDYEGGITKMRIRTSSSWTVTGTTEWCEISASSGEQTTTRGNELTLSIKQQNETLARSTVLVFTSGGETQSLNVEQTGKMSGKAIDVASWLGLGWNLGNQMDAYVNGRAEETCWNNGACTQETMNKVKALGFSSVRIPVTWLGRFGVTPKYTIDEDWLNRVYEIVEYAENAGLNAIINIHHDGADSKNWLNIKEAANSSVTNNAVKEIIAAIWQQIAMKFKEKGHFLIFESFNEIHDGGWGWGNNRKDNGRQYAILNEWNQLFVNTIRATGGKNSERFLGVPGYCTNADLTIEHFVIPTDITEGRLLVAVHNYDPYLYTLECEQSEWGHTSSKEYDGSTEESLTNSFDKLKKAFVDKGIPVYFGEMGCSNRQNERERDFVRYYLEYFCKAAKEKGISPFFWDNGAVGSGKEHSAIINHSTGEYINNSKLYIDAMVKAWTNEESSYTLKTIYDTAP